MTVMTHMIGRVYLPDLAHLGHSFLSLAPDPHKPGAAVPEGMRPKASTSDGYALRDASLPRSCPRSQLEEYDLLVEASGRRTRADRLSFSAARRGLSKSHQGGYCTLFLSEVLALSIPHADLTAG